MARTHVVLDVDVLAAVDEVAGERGRSAFLETAARRERDAAEWPTTSSG